MPGDLLTGVWHPDAAGRCPDWRAGDWERLFSQARRARLMPRLATLLQQRGWVEQAPSDAAVHLDNALRMAARQREATRWEVDCIVRAIGHLPTPIVLLKGAAYVMAGLPPADTRLFGDTDILVAADQLAAVEAALLGHGWSIMPLEPDDERYYRDLTHELPPLVHAERGSVLDVHHAISQPGARFACDSAALLAGARPLPDTPRLSVLAPADMVLHAAAHLMQEGGFARGLRDLLDLHDLLQAFAVDPGFWSALVARAQALGLGLPLLDTLTQLRRITGLAVPQDVWRALVRQCARPLRQLWMAPLLRIACRPDHPDADLPVTALVRWALYVRAHWLRMPLRKTVPHLWRKARHRLRDARTAAPPADA